jgi:hypothetical protein
LTLVELISARVAAVGVCAIAVPATKAAAIAPTTKNLVFIVLLQDMPDHESEDSPESRWFQGSRHIFGSIIRYLIEGDSLQ